MRQGHDVGVEQLPGAQHLVVALLAELVAPRALRPEVPEERGELGVGQGGHLPGGLQPVPVGRIGGQLRHLVAGEADRGHALGQTAIDDQTVGPGGVEVPLGVGQHRPDGLQSGHRAVGELILGPHGHEEQFGDAGVEIALGGASPLLPPGQVHPQLELGLHQRPIDRLVVGQAVGVDLAEAPEPLAVVAGAPFEPVGGEIVEPVVEPVAAQRRGHGRRLLELAVHQLRQQLIEGVRGRAHQPEYRNPPVGWRRVVRAGVSGPG